MTEQNTLKEEVKKLDPLIDHAKEYTETRLDLIALNVQEKLATAAVAVISGVIGGVIATIILLFMSIGAAWWAGSILGNIALGFFCVAGFYVFIGAFIFLLKERLIKIPVINFFMANIDIHEKG